MRTVMLALSLALWGVIAPVHAQPTPEDLLRQTAAVVIDVLQKERLTLERNPERVHELMDQIIFPHIDMPRVARLVLGRYWRQATPEQRTRFTQEFKRLLQRSYAAAIQTYLEEITEQAPRVKIHYAPVRRDPEDPDEVMARTVIETPRGNSYSVDYRMYLRDGEWKIYDIVIEGISLLTNYRTSLASQARRVGVDGLIAELAARNRRGDVAPAELPQ